MIDKTFAALSDPARLDLVVRLAGGPQTAGALAEPFDVSRPAISRHLRVLKEAGLVTVEVNGRQHWYHLNPAALQDVQTWLDEVQAVWKTALHSLKTYVEEKE